MSQFNLEVRSLTLPELPEPPAGAPASAYRSALLPSIIEPTTPLFFTVFLPAYRDNNPIYPATHLQLSYEYVGSGSLFLPTFIVGKDLMDKGVDGEPGLYTVEVAPRDMLRVKVSDGGTTTANLYVYAWKGEKLLGKYTVGRIERLGIEGYKAHRKATVLAADAEASGS